ncbi:MAG TPA: trypsin-like peptidase domain-containing protein [Candidatus Nanoarchaeia archaeon]|nr:trypsin-like peptidase domain-containing protein [Candidatus Nanoarchaeia archaeon]
MGLSYTLRPQGKGELADVGVIGIDRLLDFEGRYLKSDSVNGYAPFERAVDSTVLISADRNTPNSGIVVNHDGKKYLITATHVLGSKAFGTPTDLKVFERHGADIQVRNLEDMAMIYSTPKARERNLPTADVGIFLYDGNLEGVQLVNPLNPETHVAVAIGYPGIHANVWMPNLHPIVSPGKAIVQERKKQQLTPYMQKFWAEHGMLDAPEPIQKILFTGTTSLGNSGGGLFTLDGRLLGVCRGPNGTIGRETGLEEFYPVLQVLEAVNPQYCYLGDI